MSTQNATNVPPQDHMNNYLSQANLGSNPLGAMPLGQANQSHTDGLTIGQGLIQPSSKASGSFAPPSGPRIVPAPVDTNL